MRIRYSVPADFPPALDEEIRAHVHRCLPEFPNRCHGGVTFDGRDYYFSYEVRDGIVGLLMRPWDELEAALNESGMSLLDVALPRPGSERQH